MGRISLIFPDRLLINHEVRRANNTRSTEYFRLTIEKSAQPAFESKERNFFFFDHAHANRSDILKLNTGRPLSHIIILFSARANFFAGHEYILAEFDETPKIGMTGEGQRMDLEYVYFEIIFEKHFFFIVNFNIHSLCYVNVCLKLILQYYTKQSFVKM